MNIFNVGLPLHAAHLNAFVIVFPSFTAAVNAHDEVLARAPITEAHIVGMTLVFPMDNLTSH